MSVVYLLDGYNVIHRIPGLADKDGESSRNHLIRLLEIHRPQGSPKNMVTVVFDSAGAPPSAGPRLHSSVKVIFSGGESADDRIKRIVSESSAPKRMVVVTDDKDIRLFVRRLGASVLKVEEFLEKMPGAFSQKGSHPKRKSSPLESKYIPKTVEYQITSEMRKIWLEKKTKA